ncbi:MAG: ABC transporter transmembrane domain-containing protein [Paracoccaceae bacterium]
MSISEQKARVSGPILNAVLFSVFSNVLMLTGPMFMLLVYDRVLGSRSEETLVALFLLVAALFAMFGLLEFARGRLLARAGARLSSSLQRRIFGAVIDRAGRNKSNQISATALQDMEAVHVALASPVALAILDLPWTPVFIAVIFVFHPTLGWFAVGASVLLICIAILNQLVTQRRIRAASALTAEAAGFAQQAEFSAELVVGQGMETTVTDRWVDMRSAGAHCAACQHSLQKEFIACGRGRRVNNRYAGPGAIKK